MNVENQVRELKEVLDDHIKQSNKADAQAEIVLRQLLEIFECGTVEEAEVFLEELINDKEKLDTKNAADVKKLHGDMAQEGLI